MSILPKKVDESICSPLQNFSISQRGIESIRNRAIDQCQTAVDAAVDKASNEDIIANILLDNDVEKQVSFIARVISQHIKKCFEGVGNDEQSTSV